MERPRTFRPRLAARQVGLASALALSALAAAPRAATEVCGALQLSEDWGLGGSPYRVIGDLRVPAGVRLTIAPGVEVRFAAPGRASRAPACADTARSEDWADSAFIGIKVDGSLFALGEEGRPITFAPEAARPGAIGWDGIRVRARLPELVELGYCEFRGANAALACAAPAEFAVHQCLFEGNNAGAALSGGAEPTFLNCVFAGNRSAGLAWRGAAPRVSGCVFTGNRLYGIWAEGNPRAARIAYNCFWRDGEEECYGCPPGTLVLSARNPRGDSCDARGNLHTDPLFAGGPGAAKALAADPAIPTPEAKVKDAGLARLAALRGLWRKPAGGPRRGKPAVETGPYALSPYSPLIDAGHPGSAFRDRDGTPNDIGLHGGPTGRMLVPPEL